MVLLDMNRYNFTLYKKERLDFSSLFLSLRTLPLIVNPSLDDGTKKSLFGTAINTILVEVLPTDPDFFAVDFNRGHGFSSLNHKFLTHPNR